ncbi:MAG: hypothetical protein AAFY84_09805, partial [Pseudomonadota bacterium]
MRTASNRAAVKRVFVLGAGASFSASSKNKRPRLKFPSQTPLDFQFTNALLDWQVKSPKWIGEAIARIKNSWKDSIEFSEFGLEQAIIRHLGNAEFLSTANPRRTRQLPHTNEFLNDVSHLITASLERATEGSQKSYKLFSEMFKTSGEHTDKIITFNYDVLLDSYLLSYLKPQQLYFDAIKPNRNTKISKPKFPYPAMLKLHGSINWRCSTEDFYKGLLGTNAESDKPTEIDIWLSEDKCPKPDDDVSPLIVPPIPVKPITSIEIFRYLWTLAYEYLSDTEEIVVCGYSLP